MTDPELDRIAAATLAAGGIASAAIFRADSGSTAATPALELVGAAGVEGPALDALVAAVRQPGHPIARALADDGPTFDVAPMNPGGPALRTHVPLRAAEANGRALGVLAVAHDAPLTAVERQALIDLAGQATRALAG
jgi:hypothetical protein